MVLDFLRSLLGGTEEEPEQEAPRRIELPLDDVVPYVRERTEDDVRTAMDEVTRLADRVRKELAVLEDLVEGTIQASIEDEIDTRLIKAVEESRHHLHRKVGKAIGKIEFPRQERFSSFREFSRSLDAGLRMLSQASSAHIYYLSVVFPKETELIGKRLKELGVLQTELKRSMRQLKTLEELDELESLVVAVKDTGHTHSDLEDEAVHLGSRLDELDERVRALEGKLAQAREEQHEAERDIDEARDGLNEAGRRIEGRLSGVKKALKKYANTLPPGDDANRVKTYLKAPVATLVAEGADHPSFSALVTTLLTACDRGELGIKRVKASKIQAGLMELKGGALSPLISDYLERAEKVHVLEKVLATHPAVKRTLDLEAQLRKLQRDRETVVREDGSVKRESRIRTQKMDANLAHISARASELVGHKVAIKEEG